MLKLSFQPLYCPTSSFALYFSPTFLTFLFLFSFLPLLSYSLFTLPSHSLSHCLRTFFHFPFSFSLSFLALFSHCQQSKQYKLFMHLCLYGPVRMFLMRAHPLQGQVGGGKCVQLAHWYGGVTKRCRQIWLTNCALVYEPKRVGRGLVAGSRPMSTAVHRSPNKLWRSISIFNLWLMNDKYTRRPLTEEVQIRPILYPFAILFASKAEERMGRSGRKAKCSIKPVFRESCHVLGGGGNTHLQDVGLVIPWSISDMKLE